MPFAYKSTGRKFSLNPARCKGNALVGSVEKFAFQKSGLAEKCRFLSGVMTFGSKAVIVGVLAQFVLLQIKCVFFVI